MSKLTCVRFVFAGTTTKARCNTAVEAKRGCGYRKIGGLYLVGGGIGVACDRLPIPLDICPCCGQGIKQARGWTWVDVNKLVSGPHGSGLYPCRDRFYCQLCIAPAILGRAGLIWIGEEFYKTPQDFVKEGIAAGFSRRIHALPRGFKIGDTYVLLAHPKTVEVEEPISEMFPNEKTTRLKPGIFYLWLPQRVEKIMRESERNSDEAEDFVKRGITPVFVPDDDPDHQPRKKKDEEDD